MKGKSSRKVMMDFAHLKKRYWGQHMWAKGYFAVTVGNLNEQQVQKYIEERFKYLDCNYNVKFTLNFGDLSSNDCVFFGFNLDEKHFILYKSVGGMDWHFSLEEKEMK